MKLSVLLLTYNHERFIAKALDSVLMQKTDFDYEIVIGEDCSNDRTRDIVLEYTIKHPGRISLLPSAVNSGATRNLIRTYKACTGTYIALLEGDDCWTSPTKLQRQVDFLEGNPDFVLCFTNSNIIDEAGTVIKEARLDEDRMKNLSQAEIVSGLIPPTNTVVFRNNVVTNIPDIFYTSINGDILFFSMLTEQGDAAFLNDTTASYRMHDGGIWSGKPQEYMMRNVLITRRALLRLFARKYRNVLFPNVHSSYCTLMEYYKSEHRAGRFISTFLSYFLNNIRYHAFSIRKDIRYFLTGFFIILNDAIRTRNP